MSADTTEQAGRRKGIKQSRHCCCIVKPSLEEGGLERERDGRWEGVCIQGWEDLRTKKAGEDQRGWAMDVKFAKVNAMITKTPP